MTQPAPTPPASTPEDDLTSAAALANTQNVDLTLAFGVTTPNGVDVRRVNLAGDMADALRPRVAQWLASTSAKAPVAYEPGYTPDVTEIAFLANNDNPQAADINTRLFPPANIPQVPDDNFLLHAEFMALVVIGGTRRVALLKRITASKVILRPDKKFFGRISDNQVLTPINSPIIELDHAYHALLSRDHGFLAALDESERLFGLEAKIAAKVHANIQIIAAGLPVSDPAAFARVCGGNKLYRKKLQSAVSRGVFVRPVAELQAFVAQESLSLTFVDQNGTTVLIVEESNVWLANFLRFLDEDFVTGGITSTKYIANSKRKR